MLGVAPEEYRQNGAFAEYVSVPAHVLYAIPETVSYEHAALVEPFAVAAHALSLTPMELGDTVVVVGAGLIGLCLVQLLAGSQAGDIVAIDIDDTRMDLARRFGAKYIIKPGDDLGNLLMNITDGRGADVAFEVVGISDTVDMAVKSTRKGGTVTLIGNLNPKVDLPLQLVVTRQLRLQGSCAIKGEYSAILKLMEQKKIDPQALISAVAPLSEGAGWFRRLHDGEPGLNKVILTP